ncbi:hypothetical protein L798_15145 [Zootermopsis nevadensis]|uniref:SAM domain-containing protein n=1 Tax=Zootermopsis nevadensis TaxID=136037 RepID=A0A067QWZ3_ZOONE|nr:hypothetical protein L798_15145 [Zootermopsis nevadensis]
MAATGGGTVRRVKQESRLRRSGHQHQYQATPAIAFFPEPAIMPPNQAEVDGYGVYKPVPPPKPLSSCVSTTCYSPPPYRMPPFPLYGETVIPGAAASEPPATSSTSGLHTHSSKFPIEREVILSSADKNSKIPILHEYKKQRPKSASATAIAPEGPNKQLAWTEDKKAPGLTQAATMQVHDSRGPKSQVPQNSGHEFRSQYRGANGTENQFMYNGHHGGVSTGAVPRTWVASGRADDVPDSCQARNAQNFQSQAVVGRSRAPLPLEDQPRRTSQINSSDSAKGEDEVERVEEDDTERSNAQNSGLQDATKDGTKEGDKNKAFSSRTYHTIKDMISSRFGSGKAKDAVGNGEVYSTNGTEAGNKVGESGQNSTVALNNTPGASVEGSSKNVHGNPHKVTPTGRAGASIQKEDATGGISNSEELEMSRKQRVLGGGPQQVLGSTRNYSGEIPGGTFHSPRTTARRLGTGDGPPGRGADGEATMWKSGRGTPGSCSEQQGHATVQQDRGAEFLGNREYLLTQVQEPPYGYQRPHPRLQQGMLDQNGIYMVMRQNGQGYQHAVPASGKESQYGLKDQEPDMRRQNIAGVLSFQHAEGSRPLTEGSAVSNYGTPNTVGLIKREAGGSQSRRGSQSRLDEDDDEGGFVTSNNRGSSVANNLRGSNHSVRGENFTKVVGSGNYNQQHSSGQSSDYEKATQRSTGQSSSNADSGRGSTVYSGGHQVPQGGVRREASEHLDTSTESSDSPQGISGYREGLYGLPAALSTVNDSEWVDIVESELRQILDPKLHGLGHPVPPAGTNSTLSESISSMTPPLPPLSPGGGSSPSISPQNSTRYKHSSRKTPQGGTGGGAVSKSHHSSRMNSGGNMNATGNRGGWSNRGGSKNQLGPDKQHRQNGMLTSGKKGDQNKMPLSASVFGLDTTDLTSTTTGLDSLLDGHTENNSSDDDLSTTIDTTDAHAIRKQLEGLENMYSEVLKLLGVKKYGGRYQPSDPRINKRRLYGSMSSLPSSVSSRPIRDKRRQDERKKVKDIKGINKRFQRLESHVVTLARSVAHLSSEMRTQHLMIQEMENIRGEISALRSQTLAVRSQSVPRGLNNLLASGDRDALTNPTRVKKLTKFFGDEPPLLRLFLKKLGYEKYAGTFEQERVGMVELPYLTEERLQKMGIPLGPRIRILQEAQVSVCRDKIYVV